MELKNYVAQWAGEVLPGATCYLYQAGTETLANGLLDAAGAALDNPFEASSEGLIQFAAPNGEYDLRVMSGGRDSRMRVQCLDLAEQLAAANADADRAAVKADAAAAAAATAENARDAAQASGNFYPDTAAGLAATTDGQYFSVPSAESSEYLILYTNNAGGAQEVKRYPSTKLITDRLMNGYARSGYAWGVVDALNRLSVYVDKDGKFGSHELPDHAGSILTLKSVIDAMDVQVLADVAGSVIANSYQRSGYTWGVVDASGRIALGLDNSGNLILKGVSIYDLVPSDFQAIVDSVSEIQRFITPSATHVICWGDSLTQGGSDSFPALLATLSGRTVINRGMGGQASDQIIARQGGNGVTLTVSDNAIPASGPVTVTAISITLLNNAGGSGSITGKLAGVPGTLSWTTAGGYVFTRTTEGSSVTCYPNTVFIPDHGDNQFYLPVFWLGRNQFNYSQGATALATQAANVKANIAAAISKLKPVDRRFLVLGVSSGSNSFEYVGTDNYIAKRTLAADLAKLYPDNFIDIDTILVNAGTGTGQDLTDFNNGVVPASLRTDSQHLNAAGYQIVAQAVYNHIIQKGW